MASLCSSHKNQLARICDCLVILLLRTAHKAQFGAQFNPSFRTVNERQVGMSRTALIVPAPPVPTRFSPVKLAQVVSIPTLQTQPLRDF